jgi:acyl-CoA thioesterase
MLRADRASRALGMQLLTAAPGTARLQMTVTAEMVNGHGICHGGLIFTFADSAFAFACNSHGEAAVAAAASIDFLAPAQVGDELTADARELWHVGRTGIYDVVVTRADGTMIAQFRGRSKRISLPKVHR